jgi:hypothetical protein
MSARLVAILGLIALLSTSACAASPQSASSPADRGMASEAAAPRPAAQAAPAAPPAPGAPAARQQAAGGAAANQASTADQLQLPADNRMIVRTVDMTIAVGDVRDVFNKVEQLASEQRGYLGVSQIRQDGERLTASITLRVPSDPATYQATLERLRSFAERVVDENRRPRTSPSSTWTLTRDCEA